MLSKGQHAGSAGRQEGLPAAASSGERRNWLGFPLEFGHLPRKPWLQAPGTRDRGPQLLCWVQLSPRPRTLPTLPRSPCVLSVCSILPLGHRHLQTDVWQGENQVYSSAAEMEQPAVRFAGDRLRATCSHLRWLQPSRRSTAPGSPAHAMQGSSAFPTEPSSCRASALAQQHHCSRCRDVQPCPKDRLGPKPPVRKVAVMGHTGPCPQTSIIPLLNDLCRALEV